MFGKKKQLDVWTYEDKKVKELTDAICNHRERLIALCSQIIEHNGCIEMLPDGADKDVELNKVKELREHVRNILTAYDMDYKKYCSIDTTKLNHYTGLAKWSNSHEMLRIAWRIAIKQVYN